MITKKTFFVFYSRRENLSQAGKFISLIFYRRSQLEKKGFIGDILYSLSVRPVSGGNFCTGGEKRPWQGGLRF